MIFLKLTYKTLNLHHYSFNNIVMLLQVQSFVQYEFLHQCVVEYAKEVEQKLENDATDVCP